MSVAQPEQQLERLAEHLVVLDQGDADGRTDTGAL